MAHINPVIPDLSASVIPGLINSVIPGLTRDPSLNHRGCRIKSGMTAEDGCPIKSGMTAEDGCRTKSGMTVTPYSFNFSGEF